jgi:hypothetical protein
MGLDPHECLTEVDEDGDVKYSVRVQVQVLDTIVLEETLEEVTRLKSQPALEGPKRRTREGGSEWEPIKILFKNSAYEPDFTLAPPQASLAKFT